MIKIIKGKRYDTETANYLANYQNSDLWNDSNHYSETLFQKKTGEFFLHGEGGSKTKYAESRGGGSWSGGEIIIPMTVDEAREWAEKHLNGRVYESIFGKVEEEENGEMAKLQLEVDAGLLARVKKLASQNGMGLKEYVEKLFREAK